MSSKPVVPRQRAERDVDEAIGFYLTENAPEAALGFIDALEHAYRHLGRHPGMGSTRYAGELNLPGLRCFSLKKCPYLVFYLERSDYIDVWRVLHAHRNVPSWLHDPEVP